MGEALYDGGRDVHFKEICFKTDGGAIYVHKSILEAYFGYFKAYFEHESKCNNNDSDEILEPNLIDESEIYNKEWFDNFNFFEYFCGCARDKLDYKYELCAKEDKIPPPSADDRPCSIEKIGTKYIVSVSKSQMAVELLVKCIYSIDITEQLKSLGDKWEILVDFLDLYEYWIPVDHLSKLFEKKYQAIIVDLLVKSGSTNLWKILIKIDCKNLECAKTIRTKLLDKYPSSIMSGIGNQALMQHKLEDNEYYYVSILSSQTTEFIYDYYFKGKRIAFIK